jgi:GntR family transcriptional regulator
LAQIELDRTAPSPLHEQISSAIRRQIVAGTWPAQMRLPAEPVLAGSLAVSRGTLRRALRTLIDAGLLVQTRGRGTFVSPTAISQPIAQELLSLAEGLEREGIKFETEVLTASLRELRDPRAAALELAEGELVFEIRRRRLIDGAPVAVLHNYIRRQFCPGIEANDFRHKTVFGLLEGVYGLTIATGRRVFEAQAASADVAPLLDLAPGAPVLYLEQLTFLSGGEPIEYSDVWIRGDRLKLTTVLSRNVDPNRAHEAGSARFRSAQSRASASSP